MTVTQDNFEWDSEKNEINKRKHGFAFEEILEVFNDPFSLKKSILNIQRLMKKGLSVLEI